MHKLFQYEIKSDINAGALELLVIKKQESKDITVENGKIETEKASARTSSIWLHNSGSSEIRGYLSHF